MMYPIHHRMDILMRHVHNGEALKWRSQYLNDFLEEYNKIDGALLRRNYIITGVIATDDGPHMTIGVDGTRRSKPAVYLSNEIFQRMWRYVRKRIAEEEWTVETVHRERRMRCTP